MVLGKKVFAIRDILKCLLKGLHLIFEAKLPSVWQCLSTHNRDPIVGHQILTNGSPAGLHSVNNFFFVGYGQQLLLQTVLSNDFGWQKKWPRNAGKCL